MHQSVKSINPFSWVQNMLYWNTRCHQYVEEQDIQSEPTATDITLPCGPRWFCKSHQQTRCEIVHKNLANIQQIYGIKNGIATLTQTQLCGFMIAKMD